jgi:predicted DsbA family dithiol-disulfide isomerase
MTSLSNESDGVITVYGDLACPFASLALAGLRAARSRLGRPVSFDIRAFPLELINSRPHPFAALEAEKAVLAGLLPGLEWRRWRSPHSTWPVTTLLPLEAVLAAQVVGGLDAADSLDAALRRAMYVDSRCIAVLSEILTVASSCDGLDVDRLAGLLRSGQCRALLHTHLAFQEQGAVKGSPHVFTSDGQDWLNPGMTKEMVGDFLVITSFDPDVYDKIIEAA